MSIDAELLRSWDGAWRNPKLWSDLCTGPPSHSVENATEAVLAAIATPSDPSQAIQALLQEEAFEAARTLLSVPSFARAAQENGLEIDEITAECARAAVRVQARQRVHVQFALRRGRDARPFERRPPALPEWPFTDLPSRSYRMLLGTEPGYPGMAARWAPEPEDAGARSLLDALASAPQLQQAPTEENLQAVAEALSAFLVPGSGATPMRVASRHAVFEVPSLWSETLPVLTRRPGRTGLSVAIPLRGATSEVSVHRPFLYFDPEHVVRTTPPGAFRLRLGDLFALMKDPHNRRGRILSFVGRRMRAADAVPPWWLAEVPTTGERQPEDLLGDALSALFADLGLSVAPGAIDLILFLGGQLPRVTWELTARLLRSVGGRGGVPTPIDRDRVAECWAAQEFREWLDALLQQGISRDDPARHVLEVLIDDLTTQPAGDRWPRLTVSDLSDYSGLSAPTVEAAVQTLEHRGIVETACGTIALVDGGPVWHLCEGPRSREQHR